MTVRVSDVARRTFDRPARISTDPAHQRHLRRYLSDLAHPYGWGVADTLEGHSYGEMGAALVADLVPPRRPVDLLVLAFAVPDVRPGRATATYLSHLCPGRPLAFAVCDQGAAAAFTGLRLVRDYLRAGRHGRALLLVVEQAGMPFRPAGGVPPPEVPAVHCAVGLRCEADGPLRVGRVRQRTGVAPGDGGAALARDLPGGEVAVIADAALARQLAAASPATRIRAAPAGRPLTGVWWELAGAFAGPASGPTVLARHDHRLGYLCTSIFHPGR